MNPEKRALLPGIAFRSFVQRFVEPKLSEGIQDITTIDFEVRTVCFRLLMEAYCGSLRVLTSRRRYGPNSGYPSILHENASYGLGEIASQRQQPAAVRTREAPPRKRLCAWSLANLVT